MNPQKTFTAALLAAALFAAPAFAGGDPDRAAMSRGAVKEFFGLLKGALVGAIKEGGPVNAIEACNLKAPGIAEAVSKKRGWTVARTSLKLRNPGNAPDDWELGVLKQFDARRAAGEDPMKIEFSEVAMKDGEKVFRYMKAIPTAAKPCLLCHGNEKQIPAAVKAKLADAYPGDLATGYSAGQIRGAFTITQPLSH